MQIAVVGAGNMGCLYGSNFARVGEQVLMVDIWEEHVKQMQTKGLEMEGLHGKFIAPVQATIDPASAPKADIAFICVNGYSTKEAAYAAKSLLKDSGYVVTLQNGLGNVEILTEILGKERVMAGLTFHSAELLGPGKVLHTNHGPTYLGELDGSQSPRLKILHELMNRACMEPVLVEDIKATMWGKFVHNCGINAICAITGLRPGHIQEVPEVDEFQTHIIQEALALAKAKGITLPEKDPLRTIKEYCAKKFHKVSMVQHLERGRLTEIDSLNGYIVRESKKLGLSAPYNDALTKLIKGLQYIPADGTKTR